MGNEKVWLSNLNILPKQINNSLCFNKYFIKLVLISFFITCLFNKIVFFSKTKLKFEYEPKKIIFSFWEPHQKIPDYIKLCIKTWKKNLPNYEIKIFDYESVKNSLGISLFTSIISKKMTLPIQADAIRVALLNKFGGIWMDPDIIITNGEFIKEINKHDLVMIGEDSIKFQNIGFIYASKNSSIINEWLKRIIKNVDLFKKNQKYLKWNYLGNGILDKIVNNITGKTDKNFFRLDSKKINALPENNYFENFSLSHEEKYRNFYFRKGEPQIILKDTKGIILLHNSWTPIKYKKMSEKEFLEQDILLSKLLSHILKKSF